MDTWLHFDDGTKRLIYDEPPHLTGVACMCMTPEEFESQVHVEALEDAALDRCEELADRHEHAWNECKAKYDAGAWRAWVLWSAGSGEHPSGTALGCAGS